ncbi:hypothetical protein [Rhodovulum euryhalinum]|uniref:Uncharacterized protein n=1 Tax=Rhodovulum euryhalinum TaxID=35805 RepID=A0A4R2KDI7_9RHOB|nr:hypothetical protein [Rhodovulum euryhalinum]TCO71563.1 hypothetical protein EV655_10655 [Rhodovulum euryhalinum]
MVVLFRAVYLVAMAFSLSAGALVTASLFIADHAPQSGTFLGISLAVTAIFLTLGVLLFGIQRHVAAIAVVARRSDDPTAQNLRPDVARLVAYLLAGGVLLAAMLGVVTYAILARIDQGFAAFG